jgi:hypothetical protein
VVVAALWRSVLSIVSAVLLVPILAVADESPATILARRVPESPKSLTTVVGRSREGPINAKVISLAEHSKVTVISPVRWAGLSETVQRTITETYRDLSVLFGTIPPLSSTIRVMDEEAFFAATGAPRWTNALFYRGQVLIPLSLDVEPDHENVYRAVRHEFTHAVLHSLSAGRAPGWLDEGLAQWTEGDENPALQPALLHWLEGEDPVPLRLLLGGFTRLEERMVAAAYAQSLFAANTMIQSFGFRRISNFFAALRNGVNRQQAFSSAFGISEQQFEAELGQALQRWSLREGSRQVPWESSPVGASPEPSRMEAFRSIRSQLR